MRIKKNQMEKSRQTKTQYEHDGFCCYFEQHNEIHMGILLATVRAELKARNKCVRMRVAQWPTTESQNVSKMLSFKGMFLLEEEKKTRKMNSRLQHRQQKQRSEAEAQKCSGLKIRRKMQFSCGKRVMQPEYMSLTFKF